MRNLRWWLLTGLTLLTVSLMSQPAPKGFDFEAVCGFDCLPFQWIHWEGDSIYGVVDTIDAKMCERDRDYLLFAQAWTNSNAENCVKCHHPDCCNTWWYLHYCVFHYEAAYCSYQGCNRTIDIDGYSMCEEHTWNSFIEGEWCWPDHEEFLPEDDEYTTCVSGYVSEDTRLVWSSCEDSLIAYWVQTRWNNEEEFTSEHYCKEEPCLNRVPGDGMGCILHHPKYACAYKGCDLRVGIPGPCSKHSAVPYKKGSVEEDIFTAIIVAFCFLLFLWYRNRLLEKIAYLENTVSLIEKELITSDNECKLAHEKANGIRAYATDIKKALIEQGSIQVVCMKAVKNTIREVDKSLKDLSDKIEAKL